MAARGDAPGGRRGGLLSRALGRRPKSTDKLPVLPPEPPAVVVLPAVKAAAKTAAKTAPAKAVAAKAVPAKKVPAKKVAAKAPTAKTVPAKAEKAPAAKTVPAKAAKAPAAKTVPAKAAKAPAAKTPTKASPTPAVPAKKATRQLAAPGKKAAVKTQPRTPRAAASTTTGVGSSTRVTTTAPAPAKAPAKRPAAKAAAPSKRPAIAAQPVNEALSAWTPEELAEVRAELEAESRVLRKEIADASQLIDAQLTAGADGTGDDQADAGTATFEREHEMSLANNSRDMLIQTERALQRIDDGTYGACENCGRPIGKERLQAFPRATLDKQCKQREERR